MNNLADFNFCQSIPKVELHAHLNGSISEETLSKILQQNHNGTIKPASASIKKENRKTMADCFRVFKIIHEVVNNAEIVSQVVKEVIADFEADGVKYLELRSTPRDVESTGLTKRQYIETILNAIKSYRHSNNHRDVIDVRYLPSIDRGRSTDVAHETVRLVEEYMTTSDGLIVGVDFSGNPHANDGADYVGALLKARRCGLKLAVHMAEVEGQAEECRKLLALPPDRIGHGTFLWEDRHMRETVLKQRIPLEICLTSNMMSGTSPDDVTQHHSTWWRRERNHPCLISTDDKGVFATSLSKEFAIAAKAMNLPQAETFQLSKDAIDYIFADDYTKVRLRRIWDNFEISRK